MAKSTYKDLYQLVIEEIERAVSFQKYEIGDNQGTRTQLSSSPVSFTNVTGSGGGDDVVLAVASILSDIVPPSIKSGLSVTATDPISQYINVSAGTGVAAGKLHTLAVNMNMKVDFSLYPTVSVLYVNLYSDAVTIDTDVHPRKLTIAKIIVPNPGTTQFIQDKKDDSWNAYIVNLKIEHLFSDGNGNLEEDSIELLRDNIGDILADNIIGNIRLNEDLKITNTSGSLELNSEELLIKDLDGDTLSKFNRKGAYFYDTDGIELARFTSDDARIGNILITPSTIGSNNFISGNRGFRIEDDGYAEFEDVKIRGRISSSVFEYDMISAVGGKMIISNASVLSSSLTSSDTTITVDDAIFSLNEILRIKDGINEEYMMITDISSAPTYIVTRNINSSPTTPSWEKGMAIVSTGIGESGQQTGFLILDSTSNYAPFMDVAYRNSSTYNDWTVKTRVGNLEGITDADFGVLSGFGLYCDNAYITGTIYGSVFKTANSGYRIELDTDGFVAYDDESALGNEVFRIYLSGVESGNVVLGDFTNNNGIKWDKNANTLFIRGHILADDVEAGTLTGILIEGNTIQTASIGSRIVMDSDGLIAYDGESAGGNKVLQVETTGVDVGDITFGEENSAYVKWDSSEGLLLVSELQSPDYVPDTTGYKLSGTSGLEINTGTIQGIDLLNKIMIYALLLGGEA